MEEEKPEYLTVAFDLNAPTFRHKMYEAYKGTRKPMPEELRRAGTVDEGNAYCNGNECCSKEGYEADDLLGTLAVRSEAEGMDVTILSGDRDLLQLATDKVMIRLAKDCKGQDHYRELSCTAGAREISGNTSTDHRIKGFDGRQR